MAVVGGSKVTNEQVETRRESDAEVAAEGRDWLDSEIGYVLQRGAITFGVLAIGVGIWALVIKLFHVSQVVLPTPAATWHAFVMDFGVIRHNSVPTVVAGVVGYGLAVVGGIPMGALVARPGRFGAAVKTGVLAMQIFPKIAVAPLLIIWFGFGVLPKFLFVFILCFFPIVINAASGFASTPMEILELGEIVGLSAFSRLRNLSGPWALPQIFTGLKISATFSIIGALVYEFVGGNTGLGVLTVQSESNLNIPLMFACLLTVTVLGFVFYGLIAGLEVLAIPWHVSRRRLHG